MAKRKQPRKKPKPTAGKRGQKKQPRSQPESSFVLESTSLSEMRAVKKQMLQRLDFEWAIYSELAGQRRKVQDLLLEALESGSIGPINEKGWQRAVAYKYALHPLSCLGSLKSDVGGRFNIGNLNPVQFPKFPALYLAEDRETAEQELLCQANTNPKLSNHDFALSNPTSLVVVSVNFRLERCFDLTDARHLRKFVNIIKTFKISTASQAIAQSLNIEVAPLIQLPSTLRDSLLDPDWRVAPMRYDIPSNSQLFAQLVHEAGFEGILYLSKMTGKRAIALFPRNFANTEAQIELADQPPSPDVLTQITSENFNKSEMTVAELGLYHPVIKGSATKH